MLRNWQCSYHRLYFLLYCTNRSFKQPNYKSHKKDLAPTPSSFFQFLYNLMINFLWIVLMGEGFPALFFFFFFFFFFLPLAAVVVEERFWGFNQCIPFIRGVRGSSHGKFWKIQNAGKAIYHIFEAYSLCFYFPLISFLYFFLLFFKIFRLFFIF